MKTPLRILISLLLVTILMPQGCGPGKKEAPLYETGVSLELAQARKIGLSNIRYNLALTLPAAQKDSIPGTLEINLQIDKKNYPYPLILDFKETSGHIQEVQINGKPAKYTFKNEHLIIPSRQLEKGENTLSIRFLAGEESLNRNADYMYTLLVPDRARTLFPCFDQPDLKATYQLALTLPQTWDAVGNSPATGMEEHPQTQTKTISFAPTEPLSTYLFSFVAGVLNKSEHSRGERKINIYHRETEEQKTAQLDEIARQVFASLEWMEAYTGIPYPFAKYDLIILPGFQYGGMEHTGATLYKNTTLFLPPTPTLAQELSRTQLIAHETAHMWFGDFVTMDWFSGVWVKEVFANFFASRICRPLFPHVDFAINDLNFYTAAYAEDRTQGTTSIQQELPNLQYAGLIYGNIIYQKSPVMMNKLFEKMGEENFRKAIREYLQTYAYGNASWDNIADIFAKHQPQELQGSASDIKQWCNYWVYGKGMPVLSLKDEYPLLTHESGQTLAIDTLDGHPVPNLNGTFYGYIELPEETLDYLLANLYTNPALSRTGVAKRSLLITLHENWLWGNLPSDKYMNALCGYLNREKDPQIFPTLLGNIASVSGKSLSNLKQPGSPLQQQAEQALWKYASNPANKTFATQAFRTLVPVAQAPGILESIYYLWESENFSNASKIKTARYYLPTLQLSERDYTGMAYQLALKLPLLLGEKAPATREEILSVQKARLKNPDTVREFDFVSRGTTADPAALDSLFNSLLSAENRGMEPWVQSLLGLINHPLRQKHTLKYIVPALDALPDVQATGDIFFPKGWIGSVLSGHQSVQAGNLVHEYLNTHRNLLPLLRNKVLQSAYHLPRQDSRNALRSLPIIN